MTFYDKNEVNIRAKSLLASEKSQNRSQESLQDGLQEEINDWGFETIKYSKVELFQLKYFEMVDFPSHEHIRCFGINQQNIVIVTKNQRVFRQRFNDDIGCVEIEMPQDESANFGKKLINFGGHVGKQLGEGFLQIGSALVSGVQKNIFRRQSTLKLRMRKNEFVEGKLEKVFLETSGKHLIICSDQGDNYHLAYDDKELRLLNLLKGKVVKFILWEDKPSVKNFKDTLVITQENKFYRYSLTWDEVKEIYEESLDRINFSLPPDRTICQIEKICGQTSMSLIISTDQSIIILSGPFDYEQLLQRYKEPDLRKAEIPQPPRSCRSMINICYSRENLSPLTMIWTNGHSLQLFKFPQTYESLDQELLQNSTALKYGKKYDSEPSQAYAVNEQIYGVGVTEFHYYLLTIDTLTILSIITQKVVQKYDIDVKNMGNSTGMLFDCTSDCFWIYCAHGVYKLDTSSEDMEAWKLLIERKMFVKALKIATKYNSPFQRHIAGLYADDLFQNHKYLDASKYYRQSSRSFEEIFLKFLSHDDPKTILALENFLRDIEKQQSMNHQEQILHASILELMVVRLKNYERISRQTDFTDVDIMSLEECYGQLIPDQETIVQNQKAGPKILKRESILDSGIFQRIANPYGSEQRNRLVSETSTKQAVVQKQTFSVGQMKEIQTNLKIEVDKMLEVSADKLDQDLIYHILLPHGFFEECVNFALVKQNFEMVITHYIHTDQYSSVIYRLKRLQDHALILNLIIKYSYVMVKCLPKDIFEIIVNVVKKFDPAKLIGTILNVPQEQNDLSIAFLEHCVKNMHCNDIIVNNLLIFNLTNPPKIDKIMPYLYEQEKNWKEKQKINFDSQFALRLFKSLKLLLPQIAIHGLQGNYEQAVHLALKNNLLKVAKEFANKVEDEDKQKQLWMIIAVWLLERSEENIKEVVQLTRETSLLRIEDILPFFTENIKLEHFKTEICDSLKNYDDQIKRQKGMMQMYQQTQDNLKSELRMIDNKYTLVSKTKKCEECFQLLFQEQFLIFGCEHSFHKVYSVLTYKVCLWDNIRQNSLQKDRVQRLYDIHIQIQTSEKKKTDLDDEGFMSFFTSKDQSKVANTNKKSQLRLEKEFDDLISEECPYCGPQIVDTICLPMADEQEIQLTWEL